ncbi:MAG: hypothetical protein IIW12_04850, partial [Oscillospiraceae bacterium]|nr:hypothetical protein [Oscillospiraceae bacterium]
MRTSFIILIVLLSHYTDCRGNVNNCFQLENIVIRSCTAFRPWPAHRLFLKKRGRLKACPNVLLPGCFFSRP